MEYTGIYFLHVVIAETTPFSDHLGEKDIHFRRINKANIHSITQEALH